MLEQIVTWVLAASLAWEPTSRNAPLDTRKAIVQDIVAVSFDADVPPIFRGPHGRAKTALELAAIASLESFYREDIDRGAVRGKLGEVCVLQVLLPEHSLVLVHDDGSYTYSRTEGWGYADLLSDRRKCVRVAHAKARESWRACGNLSLFTSGKCDREEPLAKRRHGRAEGWFRTHPAPVTDEDAM